MRQARTLTNCGPIKVEREQYAHWRWYPKTTFSVKKLLTLSPLEKYPRNYWLAPDQKDGGEFVLSLDCEREVNWVELVNTHNGGHRDRATKELKVFISLSLNGSWQEVLHTTLVDSRRHPDPLPVQTFRFKKSRAKFVKYQQISKYGHGGGLQYFAVKQNADAGNIGGCATKKFQKGGYIWHHYRIMTRRQARDLPVQGE